MVHRTRPWIGITESADQDSLGRDAGNVWGLVCARGGYFRSFSSFLPLFLPLVLPLFRPPRLPLLPRLPILAILGVQCLRHLSAVQDGC